jgi:hypothetical protein
VIISATPIFYYHDSEKQKGMGMKVKTITSTIFIMGLYTGWDKRFYFVGT